MPKQVTGVITANMQSNTVILVDVPINGYFPTQTYHNQIIGTAGNVRNLYDYHWNRDGAMTVDAVGTVLNSHANDPYFVLLFCENMSNVFFQYMFENTLDRLKLYLQNSFGGTYTSPYLMEKYKSSTTNYPALDIRVPNNLGVWAGANFTNVKNALDTKLGALGSTVYV